MNVASLLFLSKFGANVYNEVLVFAWIRLQLILETFHFWVPFLTHKWNQVRKIRLLWKYTSTCCSFVNKVSNSTWRLDCVGVVLTSVLVIRYFKLCICLLRHLCCLMVSEPDFWLHIFNFHLLELLVEKIKFGFIKSSAFIVSTFNHRTFICASAFVQVVNMWSASGSVDHKQLFKVSLAVRLVHELDIAYLCRSHPTK